MMPARLKVSVITVCLNAVRELPETLRSVREQTYPLMESIVIDGGSEDGTLEYLQSLNPQPDVLISEPDHGIYDAMNKGIVAATGDYIIFMNAGDSFRHPSVLKDVFGDEFVVSQRPKIISGRVQFSLKGELLDLHRPRTVGQEGPGLPHQATFMAADLLKNNRFDTHYRFAGDYELWRRLKKQGLFLVHYIDRTVSVFSLGGVSTSAKNDPMRYLERAFVDSRYAGRFSLWQMIVLAGKTVIRRMLYTMMPHRLYHILLRKSWIFRS
ncbi:MAG: glycosyltransferase [Nitrospirota bacterium]|nr:glycosyltransferase [Nitrospirota bacterium]